MTQTIIATFDSPTDADDAVRELIDVGIVAAAVQVHSQETGTTPPEGDSKHVSGDHEHTHHGFFERIEQFFSNLTGERDRPAEFSHYHEAIRRGGALVSVEVSSDIEFQQVQQVLEGAGAVDIDERAAQWQSNGYTPQPYVAGGVAPGGLASTGTLRTEALGGVGASQNTAEAKAALDADVLGVDDKTSARPLGTAGAMSSTAGLTEPDDSTVPHRETVAAKERALDEPVLPTGQPYRVYRRPIDVTE